MADNNYSINDIGPIAVVLVIAIITISVGALTLSEFSGSTYSTATANTTFDNETTLNNIQGGILTVVVYGNLTRDYILPSTNYSYYANNYTILVFDTVADNGLEDVVWTYNSQTNATVIANDGLGAISDFSGWFDTIVVVIVAVILLGLVYLLVNRRGAA